MEIIKRNYQVELKGKYLPNPQKWDEQEIKELLFVFPKHLKREHDFNVASLRMRFKNRSYVAIRKKYWSLVGSTKKEESIYQDKFDFAQEKLTYDKNK